MARAKSSASPKERSAGESAAIDLGPRPQIVMLTDAEGAAAEAIRALRTRIQSQHLQAGRRALAICAPTPEIGCTFVAVNLAVALSQIGLKTLLIDGDLRGPSVDEYFDPKLEGPGLDDCLRAPNGAIADFLHESVLPDLDVLTAGAPGPSAHEQLAADRFPGLINACLRDYDITIIDTPPANSCADALRISTVVGFSLIVARKSRTLVADVKVLADQLRRERARAIGTVLNTF